MYLIILSFSSIFKGKLFSVMMRAKACVLWDSKMGQKSCCWGPRYITYIYASFWSIACSLPCISPPPPRLHLPSPHPPTTTTISVPSPLFSHNCLPCKLWFEFLFLLSCCFPLSKEEGEGIMYWLCLLSFDFEEDQSFWVYNTLLHFFYIIYFVFIVVFGMMVMQIVLKVAEKYFGGIGGVWSCSCQTLMLNSLRLQLKSLNCVHHDNLYWTLYDIYCAFIELHMIYIVHTIFGVGNVKLKFAVS